MYNNLIGSLCKGGDLERVVEVKCAMEWSGALMRPNACTWEDYRPTEKMVFDMEYQECKPDTVNYGVLMATTAEQGSQGEDIA
ncbi:hypothetical protein QJS10_CPB17g01536 [Acorus calamus]|uniref:Pentatricopeptide repeat-containing protein n=1 Tax=Acorus calamus TaxID=4465 RepID=A0AAV9CS23_ACOCL|nr:hypothetical protein QJS10_CPB17g01536 [Acorus calamus]